MQYKLFSIPSTGDADAEEDLNRFLRSHRAVSVEKELVQGGHTAYWCFCVEYLLNSPSPEGKGDGGRGRARVDYKEILSEDFVAWDASKERLREVRDAVVRFLGDTLHLKLKPVCLQGCSMGLTFLGYRIFPGRVRLAARSRKRFRHKLAQCHENYTTGRWTEEQTARHVEPLLAFVRRAESQSFRRRVIESIEGYCPKEARTA